MATDTDDKTPSPDGETPEENKSSGKPAAAKRAATRARRGKSATPPTKSATPPTKSATPPTKSAKPPAEPGPSPAETAASAPSDPEVVVRGVDIGHDATETILSAVDVGAPGTAAILEILEGAPPEGAANAPDELGVADVIVDMLNGLAGAEMQPVEVEAPVEVPFWYVMVHQVEDAEQAAAKQRRAGKLARKLTRQVERAARLLHNIFEAAATDPTVLTRHERPVARLIALLEITPPTDKPGQRMFAGLLRAERRALARAVKEG